ncbi:sugar-phosphatase [Latilactobacillus graminis]|uniref:Phosphatase YidA n=2 Tax=Latilactobacillus graminis TaxID=60519 RepID=A0AA89I4F6_9LACO|nr:sugar-phosphatase [Latilactobacillus graminis]KRM24496.1 phosphatase YidA [Latilactobacillus graminis DSM 20719]QFP79046.1 sugar-phosphatase [Latilactobacillus graminis]
MSIKLVAVDMDGTLLNENNILSPRTIKVVKAAKKHGVKIVLCTGRPLTGVTPFLKTLGLTEASDYVITFNGALVQNTATGEILVRHTLSHNQYLELETLARQIGSHLHAEDDQFIYTANRNLSPYTVSESALVNMPIRFRHVDEIDPDKVFSKVMLIDEPAILAEAKMKIPAEFFKRYQFVQSEAYFLEVLNKNAGKGNGLRDLADALNIDQTEVMAIGDQGNDLSMLEYAGFPVAMENAIPELKKIAKVVTKSNREGQDGVAHAIETYAFTPNA